MLDIFYLKCLGPETFQILDCRIFVWICVICKFIKWDIFEMEPKCKQEIHSGFIYALHAHPESNFMTYF